MIDFGLAAIDADKRREKLEKAYRVSFKYGMWIVLILAGVVIGVNSKPPKPMFISSAAVVRTCQIDHAIDCLVCTFTDSEGRVKHRNAHCPALAPSGMMAWPLARK